MKIVILTGDKQTQTINEYKMEGFKVVSPSIDEIETFLIRRRNILVSVDSISKEHRKNIIDIARQYGYNSLELIVLVKHPSEMQLTQTEYSLDEGFNRIIYQNS